MGRKIEIKKIESKKTCQVTYAKRKNSLIKKAQEISIACGVDIALITFSPFKCGRPTKYCNRERIEDVIQRYLSLSTEKRFHEVKNYKRHVRCTCHSAEKLKQLDHIKDGDNSKLNYLKKQIKDIEERIKKKSHEVEILNNKLRVYEPESAEDILPSQLVWLERKLKTALQQVQNRKKELIGTPLRRYKKFSFEKIQMENDRKDYTQFSYNSSGYSTDQQLCQDKRNPSSSLLSMQNGPSITAYRSLGFPKGSFQELLAQVSGPSYGNYTQNLSIPEAAASFPSNFYSSLALETNQPIQSDSEIQGLDLPTLRIQNYPTEETSEHNWNNLNNENITLPPTSHNFEVNPNEMINFTAQNSDFNYIDSHLHLNSQSIIIAGNNDNNSSNNNNNGSSNFEAKGGLDELFDLININLKNVIVADNNSIETNESFDELVDLTDIGLESVITANNNCNSGNSSIGNNGDCDGHFNLTNTNLVSIIVPVASDNNNNDNNDNNGGCVAFPSLENPLPNSDEAEKGDGVTTRSTIEGNKDDIGLWEMDNLKWAKDLSLEDLQILLNEL